MDFRWRSSYFSLLQHTKLKSSTEEAKSGESSPRQPTAANTGKQERDTEKILFLSGLAGLSWAD